MAEARGRNLRSLHREVLLGRYAKAGDNAKRGVQSARANGAFLAQALQARRNQRQWALDSDTHGSWLGDCEHNDYAPTGITSRHIRRQAARGIRNRTSTKIVPPVTKPKLAGMPRDMMLDEDDGMVRRRTSGQNVRRFTGRSSWPVSARRDSKREAGCKSFVMLTREAAGVALCNRGAERWVWPRGASVQKRVPLPRNMR
jgi:hypothetical protein